MKKLELLSPAGNIESFYAAINNGADAIYLSGNKFGARAYATNFNIDEIKDLIKVAHLVNVKVYVTVNTLVKEEEINECLDFVKALYENDVDAILVQDLGLAYLFHSLFPSLVLHASTQMNVTTLSEALSLKNLGFKRIVLARELEIDKIKEIKEKSGVEIEVFGHGALCMSYSGNCLLSSLIGRRSGNRGRCAGACRQKYKLVKNENVISNDAYLLSLKDLSTYKYIEKIKEAGVDSIKLEGRVKRAEYVGLITSVYRKAIDKEKINEKTDFEIKEMFNRGYTKGYIFSESNENISNTLYSNHAGVNIGKVKNAYKDYVYIDLSLMEDFDYIKIGDSIRIFSNGLEDGITLSSIDLYDKNYKFLRKIKNDEKVYKNSIIGIKTHLPLKKDMNVVKTTTLDLIDKYNDNSKILKKVPIEGIIFNKDNHLALSLIYKDDEINSKVTVASKDELEDAKSLYLDRIKNQIEKINDTYFYFSKLDIKMDNKFLVVSKINELRRDAIKALEEDILLKRSLFIHKEKDFKKLKIEKIENKTDSKIKLFVKVNTKEQYEECIKENIEYILTENELIKDLDKIIYMNDRLSIENKMIAEDISLSSPYLNVLNEFSLYYYKHIKGINTVSLSVEASKSDIESIITSYQRHYNEDPNVLVMVYGYVEAMIMKHCLINKYLGFDKKGCMECVKNSYKLRDKMNLDFPLIRANNCNLKLLNSSRLHLIKYISEMIKIGVHNFMLDFTIEEANDTGKIIKAYKDAINGKDVALILDDSTFGHYIKGIE